MSPPFLRNTEFERYWLYLPRNLSKCSECSGEALLKHIKRKTEILDEYIHLKPTFFLPALSSTNLWKRGILKSKDKYEETFSSESEEEEENVDEDFIVRKFAYNQQRKYSKRCLVGIQRRKSDLSGKRDKYSQRAENEKTRKMVRFADSLGLELEHTRLVLSTDFPPNISQAVRDAYRRAYGRKSTKILAPNFDLSSTTSSYSSKFVYLNSFRIFDDDSCLLGEVRVRNLAFEKRVFVRYTVDEWISYKDTLCNWIKSDSKNQETENLFNFCIFVPMERFSAGRKVYFAICYQCNNQEYWDNNSCKNYTVECYERPKSPWDRI